MTMRIIPGCFLGLALMLAASSAWAEPDRLPDLSDDQLLFEFYEMVSADSRESWKRAITAFRSLLATVPITFIALERGILPPAWCVALSVAAVGYPFLETVRYLNNQLVDLNPRWEHFNRELNRRGLTLDAFTALFDLHVARCRFHEVTRKLPPPE